MFFNFGRPIKDFPDQKIIQMHRNFIQLLLLVCSLTSHSLWAQNRDTVLVRMESNPFFFNVLKSNSGEIYAGTSQGIFKISNQKLEKVDEQVGYIGFNQYGKLTIEKDGLKNYVERKFLHLLPYPNQTREEFHAGIDNHFFIVSNGFLYFFEIVPYKLTYANSSVRTISSNFVGTYSGIFFRNQKMITPKFSDGYIREIQSKAFICYNDLIIRDIPEVGTPIIETEDIIHSFISQVEDVFFCSFDKRFYIATTAKLARLSTDLKSYDILYKTENGITSFLGEMKNSLYLSFNNKIVTYSITENSIDTLYQHSEPIFGGYTSIRNTYFLSENGFYVFNSDGSVKKLTDLKFAHTVLPISDTEQIISTNIGLWYFNSTSKQLSELIPGVEFNKKALFKEGDNISAGSIKGLYTFSVNAIPEIIRHNQDHTISSISQYKEVIIISSSIVLLVFIVLLWKLLLNKKKIKDVEEQLEQALEKENTLISEPKTTRQQIEEYITEKLAEASLKSITDHFQITTSQVYSILNPDKPGTIIQQLRKERVLQMKKKGKSINDIASETGLSTSYIRKINDIDEVGIGANSSKLE
jgi:AraC-like DNA-binding protein